MSTNEIIAENFAPNQWLTWPRSSIRVVDWNIDRGLKLSEIIDFLGDSKADVFLLQEVDINAYRTRQINVASEIARKLHLNYVFGREFVELSQGTKSSPAYHGQTTLSRWKISDSYIIHFQRQSDFWKPRWFKPNLPTFQERLGGRMALVSEIEIQGLRLVTYNLHLESRSDDDLRVAQLSEVLNDAATYDPELLVILAGDLNLNASMPGAAKLLMNARVREAGPTASAATTPRRHWLDAGHHIDWAFIRGSSQPIAGRVLKSVMASDHYPIFFELQLSAEQQKVISSGFMSLF
jgi:endonuclease/exonuclease/phosphatase family metal-dependent hydrolase